MAAAHQFFFLETDDVMFEQLDRFQRDPQNAEEIAFREGGFYVRARGASPEASPEVSPEASPERVTGIATEGLYARPASPAGSVLGVAIRVRGGAPGESGGAPPERERRGFMTAAQYKSLCIFVIAESRSADLLGRSIVLLLFLQKQNLANAIYLFGLGTLLSDLDLPGVARSSRRSVLVR